MSERDEMRNLFGSWNRETLLEEYVQRRDDYLPGAQEVLHEELRRRGIDDGEISAAERAYAEGLSGHPLAEEALVVVETYDDMVYATAARDLLQEHDIPSLLHGSDHMLFGPGLLRVGPDPITLKVAEHSEARARQVLSEMAPQDADASAAGDGDAA